MDELLSKITNLYAKNDMKDLVNANNEKKLLYLYCFYHYYNGDEDYLYEISDHCHYTKEFQNYAQGFFEEESFEEKIIDVLIPYYIDENNPFSKEELRFMIVQTQTMIIQYQRGVYSLAGNESLLREYWDKDTTNKIIIRIITNYEAHDFDEKVSIQNYVSSFSQDENITIEIVLNDDLDDEINQLTSNKKCVEYGELSLDKKDNYLTYGDENSVIVNITASSLRDNYTRYGKAGLLAMNLRFYVANKKVDAGLENTIRNKGELFWYLNNGIIIVCDDYKIQDTTIKLTNFSIINGGQTTRMIGVIPFDKDFVISCKVIKNKYKDNHDENLRFVSEVAEASNTQKPINSTDIIANRYEQRMLKDKLDELDIFVQIKRGDSAMVNLKENYPLPWQKTKNSELGQMLYAGICQRPGTARNSKAKIFSDSKKYNAVFGDLNYDFKIIRDLLYFKAYYAKWLTSIKKDSSADNFKRGLPKNGFYYFLASFMLMAKFAYSTTLTEFLKTDGPTTERGNFVISQRTFDHRIFNKEYENLQKPLFELFELIYERYILRVFRNMRNNYPELAYSNFTKTDSNYLNNIVLCIYDDFAYEINSRVAACLSYFIYVETNEDKLKTEELVQKAIQDYDLKKLMTEEENSDPITLRLKEELLNYRSETYKAKRIRAYKIFTNKELEVLITLRPRTIEELYKFNCFTSYPKTKIRKYGDDIVEIIRSVVGDRED